MIQINEIKQLPPEVDDLVHKGHIQDEAARGIICGYKKFTLVARDEGSSIVGVLQAYTAFAEVYVDDIWVLPSMRGKGLGKKLLESLEVKFKGKGYNNINLVTSNFQAPGFYKKCGFTAEFVRENKKNPRLSKTFFIKYFDEEKQQQGTLKDQND